MIPVRIIDRLEVSSCLEFVSTVKVSYSFSKARKQTSISTTLRVFGTHWLL